MIFPFLLAQSIQTDHNLRLLFLEGFICSHRLCLDPVGSRFDHPDIAHQLLLAVVGQFQQLDQY